MHVFATHDMYVGNEVAEQGGRHGQGPDHIFLVLPVVDVDDGKDATKTGCPSLLRRAAAHFGFWHQLAEGQSGENQEECHAGQELQGVGQLKLEKSYF